jgi:hypothetical protein
LQKDSKNITDTILNNKEDFQNVEHKKLIDGMDEKHDKHYIHNIHDGHDIHDIQD